MDTHRIKMLRKTGCLQATPLYQKLPSGGEITGNWEQTYTDKHIYDNNIQKGIYYCVM